MSMTLKKWFARAAVLALVSGLAGVAHAKQADAEAQPITPTVIPPAIVQALSDISVASHAWQASAMTADDAAAAAIVGVQQLTVAWGELEGADPRIVLASNKVALLELAGSAAPLMALSSEHVGAQLALALIEWVEDAGHVLEALGPMAPANPCFLNFTRCFAYCLSLANPVQRAACALDCEISLVSCVGEALGPVLGGLLSKPGSGSPTFP